MNIEIAYIECCKLIDAFEKDYKTFMATKYNEASVRQSFIDPFFQDVLGWDVMPKEKNPNLIEVQVEKAQKQKKEEGTKKADYAFHTIKDAKRKVAFFIEAKKPSEELDEAKHYLQVKSYARYEGLKISVLTDFQQFHIVDCRAKYNPKLPKEGDHKKFVYTDFRDKEKFAIVYNLLNRDAIYNDSINKYAATLKKVKLDRVAKDPIDIIGDEFLSYIEHLRIYIAKALKYNDYNLTGEQLTEATQKIIDRLIFTRFLEDKNIEDELWVKKWAESKNPFTTFIKDCKGFADLYNGVVYNPHSLIDKVGFVKNEDWFAVVCKEMIDPFSEFKFNFNYIPIHILGSVYERFLGSVIRATPKDVKSEQKIEVRKAGGVYYTPKYVVDYIVENTIGKQINGKKPKEVSKLHFADIACGSGSFLIGVYEYLLKYHTDYYNKNIKQAESDGCIKLANDVYRLNIRQKRDILLNNIYGVDIDAQAVEVSQLSLFLKMLEDETQETLRLKGNVLFDKIKILPNLKDNIVCGNSLIGSDISEGLLFDFDMLKNLNVMDYDSKFPKIMGNGGFDAIVGNPPYIPIEIFSESEKKYYQKNFNEFKRKYDSSVIFISKGLKLLNENGLLAYISSQTWETGENYVDFRKKIVNEYGIKEIINLPFNIFKDAYVDTGIFIFSKISNKNYKYYSYEKKEQIEAIKELSFTTIQTNLIKEPDYKLILNNNSNDILNRIVSKKFICLGEISISTQGLSGSRFEKSNSKSIKSLPFINANVKRYTFEETDNYFIEMDTKKSLLVYYEKKEKILIRRIINRQDRLDATYFDKEGVFKKDLNPFVIIDKKFNTKYVLGLINSRLFSWLYLNSSSIASKDDFRQTTLSELRKLPIRKIDSTTKQKHDKIVSLVTQLLQIKKQVAKTDKDKQFIETQCSSCENQIDKLVYELYDITSEERKIIEGEN